MGYARDERLALSARLDQAGPREPTLCEGWTTLDLAAHLVLREHRPDAGLGLLGGPLAAHTRSVQRRLAERTPYARLVQTFRAGPPPFSLFALPGADERANVVEYFVHHEDVRRAQPGWEPRKIDPGLTEVLWLRLRMARFVLRKAPVGVELARDDQPEPGPAGRGEGPDHREGAHPGRDRHRGPGGADPVGARPDGRGPGPAGRRRGRDRGPVRGALEDLSRPGGRARQCTPR